MDPVILQAKIENSRTTGTNELYNTNANMHAHNAPPQLCWDDTDGVKVRGSAKFRLYEPRPKWGKCQPFPPVHLSLSRSNWTSTVHGLSAECEPGYKMYCHDESAESSCSGGSRRNLVTLLIEKADEGNTTNGVGWAGKRTPNSKLVIFAQVSCSPSWYPVPRKHTGATK